MTTSTLELGAYAELIGKALPQPEQFNYEVTRDSIRHFAYAVSDHNALYLDQEHARQTRWQGIIAPPGYLYSHGYSSWLRMFQGLRDAEGRELAQNDNAGESWDFHRPVRPGDIVVSRGTVLRVEAKNGRRIGPCALVESEVRYTNQHDELVAVVRGISFRFNAPRVAGQGGMAKAYPPMPPGQTTRNIDTPLALPGTFPTPEREYPDQRYFEDVAVGDTITPWELGPLTVQQIARFDCAVMGRTGDWSGPIQGGAVPDAFAAGPLRIPWLGTMLTRWAGPDAWITKLSQQNREWVLVGFKIVCRGTVTGKRQEGRRHLVTCELSCESELGFVTNVGQAELELPTRSRS